jgi:PAS domain S-box-containing protein
MPQFKSIYNMIKSFLIIIGIISLLLFYTLSFYINKRETQIEEETNKHLSHEVNTLLHINAAQMMQVVNDYCLWTDLVTASNTKNEQWCKENITILKAFKYEFVIVYDKKGDLFFNSSNDSTFSKTIISKETIEAINKHKNLHFFMSTPKGLLEICASTIHQTGDYDHNRTKPAGCMFVARIWNQQFLKKIAEMSGTKIQIIQKNNSIAANNKMSNTIIPLLNWNDKYIGKILFSRPMNQSFQATQDIIYLIFIFTILVLFLSIYLAKKNIREPLTLVSDILKNDSIQSINLLKKAPAEYGRIGQLFEEYVNQKEELKSAKKKANEDEVKFRTIFESSIDAIGISKDGINVLVNRAFVNLFGYDNTDDLIGKPFLNQISPEYKEKMAYNNEYNSFQNLGIRKNGEKFPFEIKIGIYILNNEEYSMTIISDISERKETELKLLQTHNDLIRAKEKAEENDRLKTAFLQNISHEIRTPMNAIMGFSKLLIEQQNDNSNIKNYSEIILQQSKGLLEIINDIIEIAKVESGQLTIKTESCNIDDFFNSLQVFFNEPNNRLDKTAINFIIQNNYTKKDRTINTDPEKLKQIFNKLLSNSFKFTELGTITAGCKFDEKQKLIFFVSDTGSGIPLDKHETIFERFIKLNIENNKLIAGTGLGLSIVKGLVTLLGGKIWVESELGKGTTFSFSISESLYKDSIEPKISDKSQTYHFPNKNILIVEDDIFNAEFIKRMLAETDVNITLVSNGIDAIQIALEKSFDIILMDIRLPDIDGNEVTRRIKKVKPQSIIIAQTAYISDKEKEKAFDAGCTDYLCKPLDYDTLLTTLNNYLG